MANASKGFFDTKDQPAHCKVSVQVEATTRREWEEPEERWDEGVDWSELCDLDGFDAYEKTDVHEDDQAEYETIHTAVSRRYDIDDPHDLGVLGEEIAARYLYALGFKVVERNMRTRYGEADIVAKNDTYTLIVEVKTRRGADPFPEEAVDAHKCERYKKICLDYLLRNEDAGCLSFDVIGVNVIEEGVARVHHIPGVFDWEV